MDLEKEAAKYANIGKEIDPVYANGLFYGYTAGATSKYVEAEKIKAKIEAVDHFCKLNGFGSTNMHRAVIGMYEQQLKELEDERI
jgi:hypothetical protein